MFTHFLRRLLPLSCIACLLAALPSAAQTLPTSLAAMARLTPTDLPDSIPETALGLLAEAPNDQPHFLPIASEKRSAAPLADTSGRGRWDERFGMPGLNGAVHAVAVIGNEIYVGGSFRLAGGRIANNIAMWDGSSWHPLADGVNDEVYAIAIIGAEIYVGGVFTEASGLPVGRIARWNRVTKQWSTLGEGIGGNRFAYVASLAADGDDLYVGGRFLTAGKVVAVNIARWNKGRWSRVGGGANGYVFSLKVHGNDLYVGGRFTVADDKPIKRIARVDRATNEWTEIVGGVHYKDSGYVSAIETIGQDVYIGGKFREAGPDDLLVNSIAWYDSRSQRWNDLKLGVSMQRTLTDVYALAARGNQLFVGGRFDSVGDIPSGYIGESIVIGWSQRAYNFARWDAGTQTWNLFQRDPPINRAYRTGVANIGPDFSFRTGLVSNLESAYIAAFSFDATGNLVIGGSFSLAGPMVERSGNMNGIRPNDEDVYADNICLFDNDTTWSMLGSGLGGPALSLTRLGDDIIVGGGFTSAGPIAASNIARWNQSTESWNRLGPGLPDTVRALAADGSAVYAGGSFTTLDGSTPANIARWDIAQARWTAVPSSPFAPNIAVNALALQGNILYAGGANGIFAFDGSTWSTLGSNVDGPVYTITIDGDDVYVGGDFSVAGGVQSGSLAVWNSGTQSWSSVGNGVDGRVGAIAVQGRRVYVGGSFTSAGGISVRNIAMWDRMSNAWTALGEGIDGSVSALAVLDGSIFAAGIFPRIGVTPMNSIARWDGYDWHDVDRGLFDRNGEGDVRALAASNDALYAAGRFIQAGNAVSYNFGRWTSATSEAVNSEQSRIASHQEIVISPNPIAAETTIRFRLERTSTVRLSIHDMTGREIAVPLIERLDAGDHQTIWRTDELPQGAYLCRLRSGDTETTRLVIRSR